MTPSSRRAVFATMPVVGFAAALMGCTALSPATNASIAQILSVATSAMNFLAPIGAVISIFVPGASAFLPAIESGLTAALQVANTIVSTMATAAAQPLVGQIATYLQGAMTAAGQAVAVIPDPGQKASAQAVLAQVGAGIALLDAFAKGIGGIVAPAVTASVAPRLAIVPTLRVPVVR